MPVPTLAAILATAFAAGASTPSVTGDLAHGRVAIDLGANEIPYALARQPDGKLLLGGASSRPGDERSRWVLARLTAEGRLDPGFGRGGLVLRSWGAEYESDDAIRAIDIAADGRIVIAGNVGDTLLVERLAPDGSANGETVLDDDGIGCFKPSGIGVRDDGTLAVAATLGCGGESDGGVSAVVVQLDGAGTVTSRRTFAWARQRCGFASGLALQPDGRVVVVGGDGGCYEERSSFRAARLNRDGTFDPTFGRRGRVSGPFAGPYSWASDVALDSAGRIVLAGIAPGGAAGIARLRPDGSLDLKVTLSARRWQAPRTVAAATKVAVTRGDGLVFAGDLDMRRLAAARLRTSGAVASVWRERKRGCTYISTAGLVLDGAGAAVIATTAGCDATDLALVRQPV